MVSVRNWFQAQPHPQLCFSPESRSGAAKPDVYCPWFNHQNCSLFSELPVGKGGLSLKPFRRSNLSNCSSAHFSFDLFFTRSFFLSLDPVEMVLKWFMMYSTQEAVGCPLQTVSFVVRKSSWMKLWGLLFVGCEFAMCALLELVFLRDYRS